MDNPKIEHIAFIWEDPVKAADWYCSQFGMKIIQSMDKVPFRFLLQDPHSKIMLEVYRPTSIELPNYRDQNPLSLHLAFVVDDFDITYQRLLKNGATTTGDIQKPDDGDIIAMLRDPWGFPIQLIKRTKS